MRVFVSLQFQCLPGVSLSAYAFCFNAATAVVDPRFVHADGDVYEGEWFGDTAHGQEAQKITPQSHCRLASLLEDGHEPIQALSGKGPTAMRMGRRPSLCRAAWFLVFRVFLGGPSTRASGSTTASMVTAWTGAGGVARAVVCQHLPALASMCQHLPACASNVWKPFANVLRGALGGRCPLQTFLLPINARPCIPFNPQGLLSALPAMPLCPGARYEGT